jgi:hypothetical protein
MAAVLLRGQANVIDLPRAPLGDGPFIVDTAEQHKIKVTVMTKALTAPFGIAFLPNGDILVASAAASFAWCATVCWIHGRSTESPK